MATKTILTKRPVTDVLTKGKITELVQLAYLESERHIQPMPPFILIRVLPRATISAGGIILPEKQNKPNAEAVVLAVYEPYWEHVDKIDEDGKVFDISVWNECDVHIGDHIIFPHHCGLPDSFLDDQDYRLIREDDAVATLHYERKWHLRGELIYKLDRIERGPNREDPPLPDVVDELLEHYYVIPKCMEPKTKSGV